MTHDPAIVYLLLQRQPAMTLVPVRDVLLASDPEGSLIVAFEPLVRGQRHRFFYGDHRMDVYGVPVKELQFLHEPIDNVGIWSVSKHVEDVAGRVHPPALHTNFVFLRDLADLTDRVARHFARSFVNSCARVSGVRHDNHMKHECPLFLA